MTPARRHESSTDIIPFPSLYVPPADVPGPTTTGSGSEGKKQRKSLPGQRQLPFERLDTVGIQQAELLARQFRDEVLAPEAAVAIASTTTLRGYFLEVMLPRLKGERTTSTIQNYKTAISQWERFAPQFDSPDWAGMPIKLITGKYIDAFVDRARGKIRDSSLNQSRKKILAILNHAKAQKGIEAVPRPKPITVSSGNVQTYSDAEITRGYLALAERAEYQVAWVLAINAGLRPVDLFCLRWADCDLTGAAPSVTFTARKTGKEQRVPLAPVTVAHLKRLQNQGADAAPLACEFVFAGLTNPAAKDPEGSDLAVARNKRVKELLAGVGITHERPWPVCRATCNTRLKRIHDGVGPFVLGHSVQGVNAKHYTDLTQVVIETINAVPQPACFLEVL